MELIQARSIYALIFGLFFFTALAGMWVLYCRMISSYGGWRDLSAKYRATRPFYGKTFRFQSARMLGLLFYYTSCLTFGVNDDGLHLSISFPFFVGHPPIFIPWKDISFSFRKRKWFSSATLRFKKCSLIQLEISKRLAERILLPQGFRERAGKGSKPGRGQIFPLDKSLHFTIVIAWPAPREPGIRAPIITLPAPGTSAEGYSRMKRIIPSSLCQCGMQRKRIN